MEGIYLQLLNQNGLIVIETAKRMEIRIKRNLFYLTIMGVSGVGFLAFGFVTSNWEILSVSILMATLCFLSIWQKRNGRTIFIVDKENQKLVFPSNNRYEAASGMDLKGMSGISVEQAGGEHGKYYANYFFVHGATTSELLLILKKGFRTDSLIVKDLENWLRLLLAADEK